MRSSSASKLGLANPKSEDQMYPIFLVFSTCKPYCFVTKPRMGVKVSGEHRHTATIQGFLTAIMMFKYVPLDGLMKP